MKTNKGKEEPTIFKDLAGFERFLTSALRQFYRKDKELARAAYLDEDQYCALLQCEMPPNGYCYYGKKKEDIRKKTVENKA